MFKWSLTEGKSIKTNILRLGWLNICYLWLYIVCVLDMSDVNQLPHEAQRSLSPNNYILFNDALNTFYLLLYGVRHMVKNHSDRERGNPLLPHRLFSTISSTVFLYASSHRQANTYHGLCYTSRGAMAGTRNSPMGPPWRIDPMTHRTLSERSYHGATSRSTPSLKCAHISLLA